MRAPQGLARHLSEPAQIEHLVSTPPYVPWADGNHVLTRIPIPLAGFGMLEELSRLSRGKIPCVWASRSTRECALETNACAASLGRATDQTIDGDRTHHRPVWASTGLDCLNGLGIGRLGNPRRTKISEIIPGC